MARKSNKKEEKEVKKVEPVVVESPIKSGMSDTTKGMIIGVLVTALIATLVILLILGKNDGNNNSNSLSYVDPSEYSDAMKEFYEYFESDEKTLIVFASSQCGYCLAQKPIVEDIAEEYDINYLYMDYLELASDDEINQVIDELELSGGSTPTSVVVENGKVIYSWVGFVEGETYVDNLIEAGLLKEGTEYTLEENITDLNYSEFKKLLNNSKVSAVIVDVPACTVCYQERISLNELADKYDIPVYQLSSTALSEDEMNKFVDGLGDWGYTTEAYEEDKTNVQVPLLLFVRNGKIVKFEVGYVEGETNLEDLFESVGLIG